MTSPSGQLTLNFGVLSRIVKLDRRGKESLLGLELGLMGMGLLQPANTTPYPATLGAVGGVGIRLPLGGSDTAIAIHMWACTSFVAATPRTPARPMPMPRTGLSFLVPASPSEMWARTSDGIVHGPTMRISSHSTWT